MAVVITAVGAIGGLTFLLASLLLVANRKLYVQEDPRIDLVEDMLPHANCGACGEPGCRPFAEALVEIRAKPSQCTVGSAEDHARIAAFLGVDVGASNRRVARLACAGGDNVARREAVYDGVSSCRAAALVSGGGKRCFWGCLGLADCEVACTFDAIVMNEHGLPVVDPEACTACGDCVDVCPKDLFTLEPIRNRLWVACRSLERGDEVLEDCAVACTACGRCAMDAPDVVRMQGNLPIIDYQKHQNPSAIERCPTGAIVWLDDQRGPLKGGAAKKVVRREALPVVTRT